MNAHRAKPLKFPWPPLLYGLAITAAVALQRYMPLDVRSSSTWVAWIAGSGLIILATCLDIWAMRTLLDNQTSVLPHRISTHLVTTGPFRFTRNPIYLGYTLIMVGIVLITLNPWFFVMAIAAVAMTSIFAIRREELHLLSRFGVEFERYCRSTTRWI